MGSGRSEKGRQSGGTERKGAHESSFQLGCNPRIIACGSVPNGTGFNLRPPLPFRLQLR
jgi:hypothetical protein